MARRAIVLFSGGLDSTACAYWAKEKGYEKIILLSFIYGGKEDETIKRVNETFSKLLEVESQIITVPFLAEFARIKNSALISEELSVPVFQTFEQLDDKEITKETAKAVWIPARNLLFIAIAAAIADSFDETTDILFGANKEEGKTFPDNTITFVRRMNKALKLGCMNEVQIVAPFAKVGKKDIAKFLLDANAKISFSSSCYNVKGWTEKGEPIHCGHCESCMRRKRAFKENNSLDPTIYWDKH